MALTESKPTRKALAVPGARAEALDQIAVTVGDGDVAQARHLLAKAALPQPRQLSEGVGIDLADGEGLPPGRQGLEGRARVPAPLNVAPEVLLVAVPWSYGELLEAAAQVGVLPESGVEPG